MPYERNRVVEILVVEDNPSEVRLLKEALKDFSIAHHLTAVEKGEQALQFLRQEGPFIDAPRPDLILLDLNLPGRSGQQVLEDIKGDGRFSSIPVLVLTCSTSYTDVTEAYNHRANCYVCKPTNIDEYQSMLKSIERFWLTVAVLPNTA
jgi:two-component system, chemotaxis family, response regulator Rcp1